jgi:hypothetical protein
MTFSYVVLRYIRGKNYVEQWQWWKVLLIVPVLYIIFSFLPDRSCIFYLCFDQIIKQWTRKFPLKRFPTLNMWYTYFHLICMIARWNKTLGLTKFYLLLSFFSHSISSVHLSSNQIVTLISRSNARGIS